MRSQAATHPCAVHRPQLRPGTPPATTQASAKPLAPYRAVSRVFIPSDRVQFLQQIQLQEVSCNRDGGSRCACVCECTCIYMCICMYTCVYVHVCISASIYVCAGIRKKEMHICVCMYEAGTGRRRQGEGGRSPKGRRVEALWLSFSLRTVSAMSAPAGG